MIENNVSRVSRNDFAYPTACTLRFRFNDLELFWYDGGMRPRLPHEVEAHGVESSREGILFVGDDGIVLAGFHGQNPQLFQGGKSRALPLSEARPTSNKRYEPWIVACQKGGSSPGCFTQAAAITDTVNLGTIALRIGKKVAFDSEAMKITNVPEANKFLRRQYRKGWEL